MYAILARSEARKLIPPPSQWSSSLESFSLVLERTRPFSQSSTVVRSLSCEPEAERSLTFVLPDAVGAIGSPFPTANTGFTFTG